MVFCVKTKGERYFILIKGDRKIISMESINTLELVQLVQTVFPYLPQDHTLVILVDLPKTAQEDNPAWQQRRLLAQEWAESLEKSRQQLQLDHVLLVAYPNVGSNNADLPAILYQMNQKLPNNADGLALAGTPIELERLLNSAQLFIAPTEFSTTAPLKIAATQYPIRAATMPGFCVSMIPALRLNYAEISKRVNILKNKLDSACGADIFFLVDGKEEYRLHLDLRFRTAHASTGRFPDTGMVGNLPSGEAYIVPHEGEKIPSETQGTLPVQFGEEVIIYSIRNNRAVAVFGEEGEAKKREAEAIVHEPAYANIAELGFGVLADFGVHSIGEILLDEKLGLHIAFGRSDHFGGIVNAAQFTSPKSVVHIDRIYIPELQPRITIREVGFIYFTQPYEKIIEQGKYCPIF